MLLFTCDTYACKNCDKEILLDQDGWSCLEKKLPSLLDTELKLIVFKLDKECSSANKKVKYKSGKAGQPQKSNSNDKVYVVSKKQLNCLHKSLAELKSKNIQKYTLIEECAAEPSDGLQ